LLIENWLEPLQPLKVNIGTEVFEERTTNYQQTNTVFIDFILLKFVSSKKNEIYRS
jgi:hypothetical protein